MLVKYQKKQHKGVVTKMMPYQCILCKNFLKDLTCSAFPSGIPAEILTQKFDHSKPYPDIENREDNGILYEPNKDAPMNRRIV